MRKTIIPTSLILCSLMGAQTVSNYSKNQELPKIWITIFSKILDKFSQNGINSVSVCLYSAGPKYVCEATFDKKNAKKDTEIWVLLPNGSLIETIKDEKIIESRNNDMISYTFKKQQINMIGIFWYPDSNLK